ncbi:hypothetical protein KM176_00015 [Pseudooceanicola sp. CBS1P-1]|uniref:DUF1833 domain-containing protein n=1 Tax=Pseudooceanicola albus TaxID=2692189 RepID=A0A6L7FXD6_9RHOB|nr:MULTISPECIES: hypothetical protein [Pseudooceanicola]MBT9382231.1 hypothetical protein [Pseudooceanicola endophyticus]MXN16774.1 hypothetical protein [Pseudooceanicola albus]
MRRVSLNARAAQDADISGEVYVALFEITHESLTETVRLSTDPTERITSDPLVYGTRSSWRGANTATEPWLWTIASALLPSDMEDTPTSASLVLENLDSAMVKVVRSFTSLATVNMAVVLAETPDVIEAEYLGLQILSADIDAGSITLAISREEIEAEPFPSGRMTRDRFPGLHL